MDDFLILCKTRHHCRKAVKTLNQFFNHFGFQQHPDKTFIGRIEKGFDWLGYQFNQSGLIDVSPRSKENHLNKLRNLYEQSSARPDLTFNQVHTKMADYSHRWCPWARSGLQVRSQPGFENLFYASPWDVMIPSGIATE